MKKYTTRLIMRLGSAILLASTAACSGVAATPATPVPAVKAPASSTPRQQIIMEIGTAACDSDKQCRTLPLGHRACGGPEAYLAYSTKTGNADKLQRMAAEESAARKEQDTRAGMLSTCQAVLDPGASCQAGRCIARNANSGGMLTQ